MAWDVDFIRRRRGADPALRSSWLDLGPRDAVIAKLRPVLGGCAFRVVIRATSVGVSVEGEGDPFPTLRAIARALECEAVDMVERELVDLEAGRARGFVLQRKVDELVAHMRR